MSSIEIRRMRHDDEEAVRTLFMKEYMVREPMKKALGVKAGRGGEVRFNQTFSTALADGASVVAIDTDTGKLIGCAFVIKVYKGKSGQINFSTDDPDERGLAKTYEALANLHRGIDIFEKYGVDIYTELNGLTVEKGYEKQGIGYRLAEKAWELTLFQGIRVFAGEASGATGNKMCKKMGGEKLAEIFYEDMVFDGKRLKMTADLRYHRSLCLWAKALELGRRPHQDHVKGVKSNL